MEEGLDARIRELANAEIEAKVWACFYLSWAEEKRWLGGAYVYAYGPITARLRCAGMRISPGGQCAIWRLPSDYPVPPDRYRNRLLNKEELLEIDPDSKSIAEFEKEQSS